MPRNLTFEVVLFGSGDTGNLLGHDQAQIPHEWD